MLAPVWAGSIQIDSAQGAERDGKLSVDAHFNVSLDPVHENVLLDGVPLTFAIEFTLTRPRWYWAVRRVADWFSPTARIEYKLYFHPLTRTYRVDEGTGFRSFDTLGAALEALGEVHDWTIAQRGMLTRKLGSKFAGEIRMRLDLTQLPRPLQLSLLGDSAWHLESPAFLVDFDPAQ